jgi:pyruvate dehydrogenase E1 component alpha subunit
VAHSEVSSTIAETLPDFEALFPLRRVLDVADPRADVGVDDATLVEMERAMTLHRALDERLVRLQRQGRVGFHITAAGEEGLLIGSAAALAPHDWVVPGYRELGVALYRGLTVEAALANMFGNEADPVKGRQMPGHAADRVHHVLSASSPAGTQIAQAAGVGWAMRLANKGEAAVAYFGDGATSEGDFHVGVNFAGVFRAAVVFVCRARAGGLGEGQSAAATIAQKALAYGVPAERVDGSDALAVYAATREALARARRGEGPTLLEVHVARVDADARDPLERLRVFLRARGLPVTTEHAALEAALDAAIEAASRAAPPAVDTLFDDVFATRPAHLEAQRLEHAAASR